MIALLERHEAVGGGWAFQPWARLLCRLFHPWRGVRDDFEARSGSSPEGVLAVSRKRQQHRSVLSMLMEAGSKQQ